MRTLAAPDVLPHLDHPVSGSRPYLEARRGMVARKDVAAYSLVGQGVSTLEPAEQLAGDTDVVHQDTPGPPL